MSFPKTPSFIIAIVSTSLFAMAQDTNAYVSKNSTQTVESEVIDGSVHPELIPDSIANRLVLISLILPENPSRVDTTKQNVRLKRLHLNAPDLIQLTALLNNFSNAYSKWQSQLPVQDITVANSDKNKMIDDFLFSAEQQLSSIGFGRFKQYIQEEKKKMTVPK